MADLSSGGIGVEQRAIDTDNLGRHLNHYGAVLNTPPPDMYMVR